MMWVDRVVDVLAAVLTGVVLAAFVLGALHLGSAFIALGGLL